MLFPTVEFAAFFIFALSLSWGALALHRGSRTGAWRAPPGSHAHTLHKLVLLGLSYVFYGCWEWRFVPLLFALSFGGWLATRAIQHYAAWGIVRTKAWALAVGVCAALALLAWYKYSAFALQNASFLADRLGYTLHWKLDSPLLPLGISFMTFHVISMLMDAWRDKLKQPVPLVDALLYVSFFPQLIAGPILRAATFLPQLRVAPDPRRIDTGRALLLIVGGLVKKVVIANTLATLLVDDVFATPGALSASQVLLGIYGYAAQIYCDFSGYTDIAIGCALLLGYRFADNFNAPYTAVSPQDFWRRWHISLSTWLRDYLYIPLGGSRAGHWATQKNLMITMLLGGLWHGAAWNFVLWGAWHGLLLVVHREWERIFAGRQSAWRHSRWWRWASRILLFHAICLGWIFFRSADFGAAYAVLARLVTGGWYWDAPLGPLLCTVAGIGLQYVPARALLAVQLYCIRAQPLLRGVAFAGALILCEVLGPSEPAPFIYFQF